MFPIPSTTRLALYAAGGFVVALAVIWALWSFDPFNRRQRAEMRAANATAQAQASETVAKALDTHTTQTIVIKERESRAVETVQRAPGADTPIDPDLLRIWRDGLSDIETGARGGDNPAKPSGALQTP